MPTWRSHQRFRRCCEGMVTVPYRIYHDYQLINTDRLASVQVEIINCVLTRHHNGFVRQKHLQQIVSSCNIWIPPFVVQLIGEYVVEILHAIYVSRAELDAKLYRNFLRENPEFWQTTKQLTTGTQEPLCRYQWQLHLLSCDDHFGSFGLRCEMFRGKAFAPSPEPESA
jgi:hypothetical protein